MIYQKGGWLKQFQLDNALPEREQKARRGELLADTPEFEFDDIPPTTPGRYRALPHHGKHHSIARRVVVA